MKLLLEIRDKPGKIIKERTAARAVLIKGNQLAILNVTKEGYHKLPGGGVEKGETVKEALAREMLEETGCTIKIIGELGKTIEYRCKYGLKQTSFCFVAQVMREGKPDFDEGEQKAGYSLEWTDIDTALKLIGGEHPDDYEGKFIVQRDLAFLKAFKVSRQG